MDYYIETAIKAVIFAAGLAERTQKRIVGQEDKKDGTVVTTVDIACQLGILKIIRECDPNARVIAEETDVPEMFVDTINELLNINETKKDMEKNLESTDMSISQEDKKGFWTIDPIDGTAGFVSDGNYCHCVGYVSDDGTPLFGVIGHPRLKTDECPTGTIVWAAKGQGSFIMDMNGKKENKRQLCINGSGMNVLFSGSNMERDFKDISEDLKKNVFNRIEHDHGQCKVIRVLLGHGVSVFTYRPGNKPLIWDHLCGTIIFKEAGGLVGDLYGKDLDFTTGKYLLGNTGVIYCADRVQYKMIVEKFKGLLDHEDCVVPREE